jgi:hypothetical protein
MVIPITTYTSLAFSGVAYIAFIRELWLLTTLWQLLSGISVYNHINFYKDYKTKTLVRRVDTVAAHSVVIACVYIAVFKNVALIPLCIFWLCLAYMGYVFYVANFSFLPGRTWEPWHASLHTAAIVGATSLLLGYNP